MPRRAGTTEELTGVSTAVGPATAVQDQRVVRKRRPWVCEQRVGAHAVRLARAPAVRIWAQPFAQLRVLEHTAERRAKCVDILVGEPLAPRRFDACVRVREL